MRLRDLGIQIGEFPTGRWNAITDVPGVLVGHKTLIYDEPRVARTGITVIVPREDRIWTDWAFAGWHSLNGNGELTGIPWLEESGMLGSAVAITNTHQVGIARDALVRYAVDRGWPESFLLPTVAETFDGWLNDISAFHLTEAHVFEAMAAARGGPVAEGNVGGGTGMICHGFKGGIGSASRLVEVVGERTTVGALVQANYGSRRHLRIDGRPIGRLIDPAEVPLPWPVPRSAGSIIVVLATDAPLLPMQCRRLAQRATVGLARVGGTGHDGSGDIFLAFATGNHLPQKATHLRELRMVPLDQMDGLIDAAAEATEEAILNALCAAETMTGFKGRVAHALPLDRVAEIFRSGR